MKTTIELIFKEPLKIHFGKKSSTSRSKAIIRAALNFYTIKNFKGQK